MQDRLLLKQFSAYGSQAAFAEIVRRYLRLVFSICLREIGDRQVAEDATQAVFLILAQKAPSLNGHATLAGWLFRTARLTSKDALRQERRRRRREHAAAQAEADTLWPGAKPHQQAMLLNDALAALKPGEREAVLLRFGEEASFREVGAELGLSEDAAQKRVSRALEKMRAHFARHREVLSATALMGVLAAEAARTASSGCARPLLRIVPGLKLSIADSSLFGTRAYQLSEGVMRTMKMKAFVTAASVSVLAVASMSLLMAGSGKSGDGVIGTWTAKVPQLINKKPHGKIEIPPQTWADMTVRFNHDNTYTVMLSVRGANTHVIDTQTSTGAYHLAGTSLTLTTTREIQNGKSIPVHSQPAYKAAAAFSDGGKTLTLTGLNPRMVTVMRRQ